MFVLGAYLSPTLVDEPTRCSVLAMFFHYFFLCQFTWMFIEVIYLWFIGGGITYWFRRKKFCLESTKDVKSVVRSSRPTLCHHFVFLSRKICSTFYLATQLQNVLPTNFGGMNIHTLGYLTIILRNRAEYHLILSRRGRRPSWLNQGIFRKIEQDNCFIIQQILSDYHFQNEKNYGSMMKTLKTSNT